MAKFTSNVTINTRWRNNDFVGAAGSTHTFPDAFYDEFLIDWADQLAKGNLVITETPTTGNIQVSTLTVGDIVLTGTATGNFNAGSGTTVIGTSPISVATSGSTATVSLAANYQTAGTYVTSVAGTSPISTSGTTAVTVSINQAILSTAAATSALNLRTLVRNTTASTIAKGSFVYLSSSNGTIPTVEKALATTDATSSRTFGVVDADIASNSNGYVLNQGIIDGLDTRGAADGQVLWLSTSVAGAFTTVKPVGPSHGVLLGVCVKGASAGSGSIYVFIKNGSELDEIHDVNISGQTNGQALVWNAAQSVWTNQNNVNSIAGTAPITTSTTTDGAATVGVSTGTTSATVALGNHLHTGVYQPSGTYVTAVNGTAPIAVSTTTAGISTVSLTASYASAIHTHATTDVTSGNFVATLAAGTGVTVTGADANAAAKTVAIGQAVATNSTVTFNQINVSDYINLSGWNQASASNDASATSVTVTTAGTYYAIAQSGSTAEVSFTPDFVGQDFFVTITGYASLNTTVVQYSFVRVDVTDSANTQIAILGYGRSDNFGTTGRGGTIALNKIWVADSTSARKIKLYGTTQTTSGLSLSLSYWQINVMALA